MQAVDVSAVSSKQDDLTRFPDENPNPVMRVSNSGQLLYANPATDYLLKQWARSLHSNHA